jgi:hypothetical protein
VGDAKDEKLTVMVTSTDQQMLKAMAKTQDASVSDVVRKLVRQEFARVGADTGLQSETTRAVQRAFHGIVVEHAAFLDRLRIADGRGTASHHALDAHLDQLERACERTTAPPRPGLVAERLGRYRVALKNAPALYPDTARLQGAYDQLAFLIDDWLDELKAVDIRAGVPTRADAVPLGRAANWAMNRLALGYQQAGFPPIESWTFTAATNDSSIAELAARALLQQVGPTASGLASYRLTELGQRWAMAHVQVS